MSEFISNVKAFANQELTEKENIRFEYGWHNPRYPPEIRRACLGRNEIKMDKNAQLYFLMSGWYEKISGCRAPCNFEVYGDWKRKLSIGGMKKYGLNQREIGWLIDSIQAGTCFCKEKRDLDQILSVLLHCEDFILSEKTPTSISGE